MLCIKKECTFSRSLLRNKRKQGEQYVSPCRGLFCDNDQMTVYFPSYVAYSSSLHSIREMQDGAS